MGRFFGREPRVSRQEAEAQAKQAIDAAVSRGRPPADEWKGLASRMGDLNRELATRPPVDLPAPPPRREPEGTTAGRARPVNQILRPRPAPAPELIAPEPPPPARAPRPAKAAAPAPAKRAPTKAAAPAKRATKAAVPAKRAPAKAAAPAPAPAKRAAAKKRSG